ncbi:MAG: ATP synthase F0 subunit B [Lawsonibacter sp.]|nr:ATP synthase F0 subunit B [Lawsonibacter sp.]
MNIPLNIDWQQILLHLLNFAVLAGGLYWLLYSPVKAFLAKREAYYQNLEEEAQKRTEAAARMEQDCRQQMELLEEEIRVRRAEAQSELRRSIQAQTEEAKEQAARILADARAAASLERDKMMRSANQELSAMAAAAAEKMLLQAMALKAEGNPYDQFLRMTEGGGTDGSK